ncbi:hypothetical protein AAFF_G00225380 [Aldrovandia affinis]|uniref:Roc domain-containing protein n=1 Tax=Aldrovandia affinis TaxID=143900 RepID=A0AAD7TB49_9TELE|nr:hypothetical protein AAFF_G00225380 [Aldrovandia affinis]
MTQLRTMAQSNGFQQGEKRDFSRKKLKELPREVLAPGNVQNLYLQNNRLKQVCGISALCNIRELNLSCNEFSEFPGEIGELQHLEKLYLNQNCISKIPDGIFSRLEKLEFLKLSTNRLATLPSDLGNCKRLQYLNLSNNCLRDLKALEGLSSLKELYVKSNNLTDLPTGIFLNADLTMFKAAGNPLREPPEEVCMGGVKDIQRYFMMLGSSGQCVRRVKTMFLGSSMAGKSTICRSLREGSPVQVDAADRTVGIEISEVEMRGIKFLFWDFAGHEEYYFTHHVFITPQALVILTINLASYDVNNPQSFKDSVSFWINNVKLRVPESVVLLVGTHADQCMGTADVQEKKADIETKVAAMLKERKANLEMRIKNIEEDQEDPAQLRALQKFTKQKLKVLDLVPMDCTKTEDIENFQNYILCQVQDKDLFPSIERTLPHRYQEVESSIQDLKENKDIPEHGIMSIEDILIDLNTKLGELDREDLQCILRYLHRIGIIVWYVEISALQETVFVEPSFLIKLFKTTVRHDLVNQLQDITRDQLVEERSLVIHRDRWIDDLKGKATLHNAAIRVLLRKSLQELEMDDDDIVKEIVGTRSRDGKFLDLLRHFEICLPAQLSSPLNPQAPIFFPNRKWEPSKPSVHNPGACLFPNYLRDNGTVLKMWGEDSNEDIQVQVYFLPEVPHGFFHRLIIRACSFYPTHWVGKDHCLVSSSNRLVLLKEKCARGDQLIEIRCRRPDRAHLCTDAQMWRSSWDMMLVVLQKLTLLTHQWPGLCLYVCSPCRVDTCSAHFPWMDWKDLDGSDIYNMVKEEKLLCSHGHTHQAELLFPKVPRDIKSDDE